MTDSDRSSPAPSPPQSSLAKGKGRAFTWSVTARASDIDELGHVNNAVWVRWIQDIATAHWRHAAAPEHVDIYVWVVIRHEIDYLGNVTEGETVTARTWVPSWPRGARFDRWIEFTGPDGKPKVRAKTTWAMIEIATGRIGRVPRAVAANFVEEEEPRSS